MGKRPFDPMTPTEQLIFDAVQERPRRREELWQLIWGDDPDGGPLTPNALWMHISNLNKKLAPHAQAVRFTYHRYRLGSVAAPPPSQAARVEAFMGLSLPT